MSSARDYILTYSGKESLASFLQEMQEVQVWSLGQEEPLEEEMAIHFIILPWEPHGQRSLAGYDPEDSKESTMAEATWHALGIRKEENKTHG